MVKYALKEKILKFLIENKESPHSIMEISKKLKADYKNTSQALNNLNHKTYSKKKLGNTYLIEFSPGSNTETLSIEENRTEEFLSNHPKLRVLKKYIEELGYPFLIVLVFGSYAKNIKTKNSDVDVCVILDDKIKLKKLQERLGLLSLKLELHEFSTGEFVSMIEKSKNNLGHEIVRRNIILYGKEAYYNLISDG